MSACRRLAGVHAVVLLFLAALPPNAATADEPTGPAVVPASEGSPDLLRLHHSSEPIRLTPGETSSWDIRLDVLEEHLDSLTVSLDSPPSSGEGSLDDLLISASACSHPYTERGCEGRETVLMVPTPFDEVSESVSTTLDPAAGPRGTVHVRVDAALAADARAPGPRMQLVFAATAIGAPNAAGTTGRPAGSTPDGPRNLATTGAALLPYLVLGAGAVAVGCVIATLARRTRSAEEL